MKKIFSVLTSLILLGALTIKAQAATYPDAPYFALEPTAVGSPVVWQGQNSASPSGDHYGRNLYYNFNSGAFSSGVYNTAPSYYGVIDKGTTAGSFYTNGTTADKMTVASGESSLTTMDTNISGNSTATPGILSGQLGITGAHKDQNIGTATFTIANLINSKNTFSQYVYVEMDVSLLNGSVGGSLGTSSVSLTLVPSAGSISDSWAGTQTTGTGSGVLNPSLAPTYDSTTKTYTWNFGNTSSVTTQTVDAWFQVSDFPSSDSLLVTFVGGDASNSSSGNGTAFIDNMHIATTPEPMALALFATGVAVLFFFRRRRMGLQVA